MELNPQFILTDFERAAINALKREYPNARSKGRLFHLGQSVWRQIQTSSLGMRYGEDEEFSLKLRHIVALAFLQTSEIPDAFDELKSIIPDEASEIMQWFENNYVHGRIKRITSDGNVSRSAPLFPPTFGSVVEQMELGIPRTQNRVEAWNRRFGTLVGNCDVGVCTIIEKIKKEQIHFERIGENIVRGPANSPSRSEYVEREKRITKIINDRANQSKLLFLKDIAHNIKL